MCSVHGCMYTHENVARVDKSKTSVEVYRLGYSSDAESVVELETDETTQAGTKGFKCESDMIFARELHVIALRIYVNTSCN